MLWGLLVHQLLSRSGAWWEFGCYLSSKTTRLSLLHFRINMVSLMNLRLSLLLQTYIFTDSPDEDISSEGRSSFFCRIGVNFWIFALHSLCVSVLTGFNVVVTDCSPEHSHQALSCKMAAEYHHFMASDKKWVGR